MTIHLPIAAGIGIEGIIWLIILIFWGIAQAVQKSRNSRRPGGPAAPGRPAAPFDDELREMLEQLSGRTAAPDRGELVEEIELEEERPAPPPPPPPRPKPPPPPRREQRPPRPAPSLHTTRPPHRPSRPAHPIEPIEPSAIPEMAAAISAEDFAAAGVSLRSGLNSPGLSMRMKGMSMQGIATMPSGNPSGRHGAPILTLRDLRDERQLRRAILAKAILDPPRGLVPYGRAP